MEILIKAGQLFLSLSILVILHEGGHFLPAKLFKIKVEKFYLFFDPWFSLIKKKIGETEYGMGWLPLGGYVKIAGMVDESMDTKDLDKAPEPWEFRAKPAWQRLIVMLGGVTVNVILGFLIYSMIVFVWGSDQIQQKDIPQGYAVSSVMKEYGLKDGDIPIKINGRVLEDTFQASRMLLLRDVKTITVRRQNQEETITFPDNIDTKLFESGQVISFSPFVSTKIDSVIKGSSAEKIGILKGDKITKINNIPTPHFGIVSRMLAQTKGNNPVNIEVERNGEKKEFSAKLQDNKLGIYAGSLLNEMKFTHIKYSLTKSISKGLYYGYWTLHDYIAQFKFIFTKKGASQVGGFASMAKMFAPVWDWHRFWETTAMLSMILAFMNVLPIPALDGGHTVFLIYEMITGRKPHKKVLEYAQLTGMMLLLALMIYANGNDLYRWIFG